MMMLFLYVMFGSLCVVIMYAMKKKYVGYMIIIVMTMTVVNHGALWMIDQKVKWEKRTDAINEKLEKVGESIDKLTGVKEDIENNSAVKGVKKTSDKINSIDKSIKDFGFGIREKITGTKVKREE